MLLPHRSAFCTTREASTMLEVSLRTAQLWVDSGILEAWKTEGGHRRISLESIRRLMAGKSTPRTATEQAPEVVHRLRVLVVEDDNVLLKLYRMRIDAWKLPVDLVTVSNGYEALVLIGRDSPDLMIADLNIPGIDGFRMVRTLATSSFRDGMEVVIVTGLEPDQIEAKGGVPEGFQVFPKPVPFSKLRLIAEQLLARRAALSVGRVE